MRLDGCSSGVLLQMAQAGVRSLRKMEVAHIGREMHTGNTFCRDVACKDFTPPPGLDWWEVGWRRDNRPPRSSSKESHLL
eukprot:1697857-Karenia_brevis.AAC.1